MTAPNHAAHTLSFGFTGKGGEYFRIWIVNLALTLLTLGVYSAWAKVRRLQYFYRNTQLAGASFDYHGDPKAILKGRVVAVGLLLLYNVTVELYMPLGLAVLAVLVAIVPWLLQRSFCFRLGNSSYRGLRFRFAGTTGESYGVFLVWPALAVFSLGLLWPLAHQRMKAYQHRNSRYGTSPLGFDASAGVFYSLYLRLALMLAGLLILAVILTGSNLFGLVNSAQLTKEQILALAGMLVTTLLGIYLLAFLIIGPWFTARLQNLVWNATVLGPHRLASRVRARDLLAIYLTNFLAIVLTLGLFKPYADIRLAKYRMDRMALLARTDLEEFIADQVQQVGAMGEEAGEVLGLDIAF